MKSPNEIKTFAEKKYTSFLISYLSGYDFFPLKIPNKKEKLSFTKRLDIEKKLADNSKEKKGYGYTIQYKEINKRAEGKQIIIDKISIQTQNDYLKLINKENDFKVFVELTNAILNQFPELSEWIKKNPAKINENKDNWSDLLKVCRYFVSEHKRNTYYIRELPIKIHTKFIENNKTILNSLLSDLLPDEMINSAYSGKINNNSFEKRYYLKYDKSQIRFRILDPKLFIYGLISDISTLPDEFDKLNFNCETIFIAENKMNILTFPQIKNAIIIFGSGKGIKQLKNASWIFDKQIFYWGDIDVQGFEILNQLRSYSPDSKIISLLMNKKTLNDFKEDIDKGEISNVKNLQHLTSSEKETYGYIKDDNLRLEQEKINQDYVENELKILKL